MKSLKALSLLLVLFCCKPLAYESTWIRLSEGKFYTFNTPALISYPDIHPVIFSDGTKFSEGVSLTDGEAGSSWPLNENWIAWKNRQVSITLDLGRTFAVSDIQIRAMSRTEWTISYPEWVEIETSLDGVSWASPTRVHFPSDPVNGGYQTHIASLHSWQSTRFVKYKFPHQADHLFIDEMFVYGASANQHPKMEVPNETYHGAFPVNTSGGLTINSFEQQTESILDMVLWYAALEPSTPTYTHLTNTLLPMLGGRHLQFALLPRHVTAAEISEGQKDEAIRTWFRAVKDVAYPMWIRVMPEMNGCWIGPSSGPGSCGDFEPTLVYGADPGPFVSAWRRMYNIAEKMGVASSIHAFVWAPATEGEASEPYYPGDQYVDWVGMSVYIDDCVDIAGRCDQEFHEKISPYYYEYENRKPMMIAEGGCRHKGVSVS